MIGTFWNLCRACPSMPVDKLHSEYRSTYRWHEYTGPRQEVVRRPPQTATTIGSAAEPALHRRRKHPELAYRAHDFLVMFDGDSDDFLGRTVVYDRARSEERWSVSRQKSSRRSKSEGPPVAHPSYRLIYNKSKGSGSPLLTNTDRRGSDPIENDENKAPLDSSRNLNSESTTNDKKPSRRKNERSEYRLQFAWPPVSRVLSSHIRDIQNTPRKSISMNGFKMRSALEEETVPVHKKPPPDQKIDRDTVDTSVSKKLKSTELIPINTEDANTIKKEDIFQNSIRSEYKLKFQDFNNYDYYEDKGVFEKKAPPVESVFKSSSKMNSPSSSWYKEVVLLRKKANQYRHRGWGTELVPDHIAQLYSDQLNVWEQVSRRSTLSALALASTLATKRPDFKEERDKDTRKNSPTKIPTRAKSKQPSEHSGNARSNKKTLAERASPSKYCSKIQNSSVQVSPHTTCSSSVSQRGVKLKRTPRPTSLLTSGNLNTKDNNEKEDPIEFPEVNEEQIIKSPPEPTRVKSPEQILMRSPEPVNWTVPLDTGKTFTVTQNVREGDLVNRSYSEARAWTPSNIPPPASISAPPELQELTQTDIPC